MAQLSPYVRQQAFKLGISSPSAVLHFFLSGTSTPTAVFTQDGTSLGTTLTADSTGRFVAFFLGPITYRITLLDSTGATIWGPEDGITNTPAVAASPGATTQILFNDATVTAGDAGLTYDKTTDRLTAGLLTVTGGQIAFPGTQAASTDVNTLDDYEEGSWTPVLGGSGGTSGQTYTTQQGRYVKVGKIVHVAFDLTLSAKGTITTNAQIQGLPFTSASGFQQATGLFYYNSLGTTWVNVMGLIQPSGTTAGVNGAAAASSSNAANLTTADITNTTALIGAFSYIAAA